MTARERPVADVASEEWAIEGLRGLAALVVVYGHYRVFAGLPPSLMDLSFTGVDLFFVLSGFVFAPYFFGRSLALAPFLVRRVCRIYPLYLLALATYAGLRLWQGQGVDHLLPHLLFLHTWQSFEVAFHFNVAFWSLPPEVEFYLALPLLARMVRGPRSLLVLTGLALAVHLVLAYHSPALPETANTAYILGLHLPGLLVEFLLGAWAWWLARRLQSTPARLACVGAGVAGWLALAVGFQQLGPAGVAASALWRGNLGLAAALCFVGITAGGVHAVARPWSGLRRTALVLGQLSYGVYLFHNAAPVLVARLGLAWPAWGQALLALALTMALAAVLHRVVEAPARAWGRRWGRRHAAAVAG